MRSFYGWVILHCVYVPQLLYSFICRWTSRLLPCSSCCKQCCNEQWDTCVFFHFGFLRVCLLFWKNLVKSIGSIYTLLYTSNTTAYDFCIFLSSIWNPLCTVKVGQLVVLRFLSSSSCTIWAGHKAVLDKKLLSNFPVSVNRRDKGKFSLVPLGEKRVYLPFTYFPLSTDKNMSSFKLCRQGSILWIAGQK